MAKAMEELMAELGERVANLEARLDAQGQDLAEIRQSVIRVEVRIDRFEDKMERRFESVDNAIRSMGTEMHTQFRWVMGGIGGAVLAALREKVKA
jgi:BMFP domain-containing protein YqiC